MEHKISRTLDAILARVTFDLTKGDVRSSYKDRIAIEILRDEGSMANRAIASAVRDSELHSIPVRIERLIGSQPQNEQLSPEEFIRSYREQLIGQNDGLRNVSTAHVLADIADDTTTATSQILAACGITSKTMRDAVNGMVGSISEIQSEVRFIPSDSYLGLTDTAHDNAHSKDTALIEKCGTDLTHLAREGKIDPVIGRDTEIDRVIQILARRKKNNPILIGEAGVGKSAIVEGLALRIASSEVPYNIRNKTIYSLDMASLVAGTKFRGEFEERIQQLVDELRRDANIIVFIDEIHTIVGAGATQGSLDTANMLKPALSRGELQTIGATTLDEFREHIESDPALERRFQKVIITPATAEQTLDILRNVAPHYEKFHNVRYSDEALRACVRLTERYITDRNFPDKAIDVMDETGARAHLLTAREPESIRQTERQMQLAAHERDAAVTAFVYERAAEARLREIALKSRLQEQRTAWRRDMECNPAIVEVSDVEHVITTMTGIPVERISQNEAERLRTIAKHLRGRVIGQDEAVERVSRALQRSRAGLCDGNRPIGVFLFVGPTGVGKTLLAKELSKWLFDHKQGLIRIDMSEYGEKHNVSRLIGSPPGYVGYGEGGQLTEAVRRNPYSVILFDEIEKAHPEVFNSMLQIFDEGHITDGAGRKVDFRNTVIILTSNVGSRAAAEKSVQVGYNTSTKQAADTAMSLGQYRKALERTFAPEFINRIDDIICFRTLTDDDVASIIDLELDAMLARTKALGYEVKITSEAKRRLAAMGYEPRYGVRSLRRTLLDRIEAPLSTLIIEGRLQSGGCVTVEPDDNDEIVLNVA